MRGNSAREVSAPVALDVQRLKSGSFEFPVSSFEFPVSSFEFPVSSFEFRQFELDFEAGRFRTAVYP